MAQLCCTDEAVAIAVENLESFDQLLFRVSVLHSKFRRPRNTPITLMEKVYMLRTASNDHDIKCVLHLASHQRQELWEVDGAVTIGINLACHVLRLVQIVWPSRDQRKVPTAIAHHAPDSTDYSKKHLASLIIS